MDESRIRLSQDIAQNTNYLNKEVCYLKNTAINEYDITSAGFTVIKFKKLLSDTQIQDLEKLEKYERNVQIGKIMLKKPNIAKEIIETLAKVREAFVVINEIYPEDILTIKKDAIFLIKKVPQKLRIKEFDFRAKSAYTSYCYLNRKEFYFSSVSKEMDVKGISDNVRELQGNFLLKDIQRFLELAEKFPPDQMFSLLKNYRAKYLERKLDKETYRDLDTGMFKLRDYTMENISDEDLQEIDISQNYLNYLVPLFNILI
jgi:hypothetical protein